MTSPIRAQSVSVFLRNAGFERSEAHTTRVRGYATYTQGYEVRGDRDSVIVDYVLSKRTGEALRERLEAMAAVLAERWTVAWEKAGMSDVSLRLRLTFKPLPAKDPKLGDNQKHVLRTLREFNEGIWTPGCGWLWTNHSTTVRLLDSLVKHGLVVRVSGEAYKERYEVTDAGRAFKITWS